MKQDVVSALKGYIYSLQKLGNDAGPAISYTQPFVTISRQAGAGGITIGRKLRDRLQEVDKEATSDWHWLDRELVDEVIKEHKLQEQLALVRDETQYGSLMRWFDDSFGNLPAWSTVVRKTGETIVHLANMGNVILVGRGSHILTRKHPGGLHVRLVGSEGRRIAHLMDYYNLGREDAERMMVREDRGRARYIKDHYQADIDDASRYDLVINTDELSYDDVALLTADEVLRIRCRLRGAANTEERDHTNSALLSQ